MVFEHKKNGDSSSPEATTSGHYLPDVQPCRPHDCSQNSDAEPTFFEEEDIPSPGSTQIFFKMDDSPSPRDVISSARHDAGVRGPKFYKHDRHPNSSQLPKLTGVARERFKVQKLRVEQWQAENNITLEDQTTVRENHKAVQKLLRERKRQKKLERRLEATSMLNVDRDSLVALPEDVPVDNDAEGPMEDMTFGSPKNT